jgi:hypothetical protein
MRKTNGMKKLLTVAAVAEAVTGVALIVIPSLVGRLLLGAELFGVAVVVGRVGGIALFALGIACWPGGGIARSLCGMLTYSVLATLYLLYLGIRGEWVGPLLWSAVVLHAVLTCLLAGAWCNAHKEGSCGARLR